MHATLDALATALYVQIDDFLPARSGRGHPPKLSDAELITLAVCQMLLGLPNDRQFLALARYRLGHLFPNLIKQPGYNKRVRRLGPQITQAIGHLAQVSPSFVISSDPSTMCHTSSSSCECAWIDAPASTS